MLHPYIMLYTTKPFKTKFISRSNIQVYAFWIIFDHVDIVATKWPHKKNSKKKNDHTKSSFKITVYFVGRKKPWNLLGRCSQSIQKYNKNLNKNISKGYSNKKSTTYIDICIYIFFFLFTIHHRFIQKLCSYTHTNLY